MRGTVFIPPFKGAHRWFVISNVIQGELLTVNITDVDNCLHSTCILQPGDHPWITKVSAVYYRHAKAWAEAALQNSLGMCNICQDLCPEPILQRIIQGGRDSDELAGKFLKFLE